jgi:hypothetical protein
MTYLVGMELLVNRGSHLIRLLKVIEFGLKNPHMADEMPPYVQKGEVQFSYEDSFGVIYISNSL